MPLLQKRLITTLDGNRVAQVNSAVMLYSQLLEANETEKKKLSIYSASC